MYAPDASFLAISPQQRECLDQSLLPSVMIEIPCGLNWSQNEWLKICHVIYLREEKVCIHHLLSLSADYWACWQRYVQNRVVSC